jgi:4-hydroxy-4-methyl-2-oxoglutarate aldolase
MGEAIVQRTGSPNRVSLVQIEQKESESQHDYAQRLAQEFSHHSTTNVSDSCDRYRIKGGLEGILPIVEGVKMCGTAFTVRFLPAEQVQKKPWPTYIDHAKPGDVVVIDNGGRTYCTIWGGLLTLKAIETKIAGTVIYGCCRDVDVIRANRYPVFSKCRFVMTGKDRLQLDSMNQPVTIADVLVSPNDIIVGDDSGVVCVPIAKAAQILESANDVATKEGGIAQAVKEGSSLTDARKKFGYGELQRPKD